MKIISKFSSPPKYSSQRLGSRCDNSALCFLLKSKHIENLKSFPFKLLCLQNAPLEMMNANWTIVPISFEVAIKFHIMCGNDKKVWFSPRSTTFYHCFTFHWTLKGILTILPNVFCSNFETSSLQKRFQRIVFSKKFHWTRERHFWQAPRKLFLPKVILSHRLKSGKDE